MFTRFPFYQQLDAMDCGPSCLRMVAAYHGRYYGLQFLRERSFIDRDGVSLLGIRKAAEELGFEVLTARMPLVANEEYRTGLRDVPLPVIVHWDDNHFVVVYRITDTAVHIADPASGRQRLDYETFYRHWMGEHQTGITMLLTPTPAFYEREGQPRAESWQGFAYLLRFVYPYRRLLVQLGLGLLVMGVLQLLFPFLTQAIVDIGIDNQDFSFITIMLVAMLFIFLGEVTVSALQGWILLHVGTRVNVSLVSQFLSKIMRLPLGFFDQKTMGDLLQRIQDQRRIEQFLTTSSLMALFSFFSLLVLGVVLFYYHRLIFFIFAIAAVVYVLWIWLFLEERAQIDHRRFRDLTDNQNVLIEIIQGMPEIKLQQSEHKRRWQWIGVQSRLFETNTRFLTITQYQDIGARTISQLKDVLIIYFAARGVVQGELSLGMMLAIQYIIGQLNVPLQQMVGFARTAQDARLSLERLSELHVLADEEDPSVDKIEEVPPTGDLLVEELSFAYNPLVGNVLENINLRIPRGKVTALVGASGSGKTTLVKLLLGFYEPTDGKITVGSSSLTDISKQRWRAACGAVLQDGYLFSDTIARNIAESADRITPERLQQAVETANLLPFLEVLPKKWNTQIGAKGNGISQGQRQRVLIARAVYKNPDFLFFDEATNALDAENERIIVANLHRFFEGRTVVVVAHRLSTVRDADQIVVLEQGQVVEVGTHETLVARQGRYRELIQNQLELGA
jgi:ATP-binding cassette subfamily B protein